MTLKAINAAKEKKRNKNKLYFLLVSVLLKSSVLNLVCVRVCVCVCVCVCMPFCLPNCIPSFNPPRVCVCASCPKPNQAFLQMKPNHAFTLSNGEAAHNYPRCQLTQVNNNNHPRDLLCRSPIQSNWDLIISYFPSYCYPTIKTHQTPRI